MSRKFSEQELVRRNKLLKYKEMGIEPYPTTKIALDFSSTLLEKYNNFSKEELHDKNFNTSLSGRIMTIRGPFISIQDTKGKTQFYFSKKDHPDLVPLFETLDIGDIIWASGSVMKTNTGDLALKINDLTLLSKALRPLPEKYHGLVDVEERYRRRYVDLIMSNETKNIFRTRSLIINEIRNYLNGNDYIEVDTPVLQPILGGASAKPFITHYNALNMPFYLRIAPELPLKKILVGGFDRVYEIPRNFRNEGVDTTHSPEFTMVEFYEAYSNFEGMMKRTEEIFSHIAKKLGKEELEYGGHKISLKTPFRKIDMVDETSKHVGIDLKKATTEELVDLCKKHGVEIEKYYKYGHIINALFEHFVEKTLIQPTFVYGHPIEISPLSQKKRQDPRFTERAELFICKKEYANMYTELNDPIDQLERFESQLKEKEMGNDEANEIDMDFVEALEYGMPPAGGCGIGIDRLCMLFTQKESISEVIFFPHLKNREKND